MRKNILAVAAALCSLPALAQEAPMDAGSLAHEVDRLAVTARVLYVAAHPDDENTRLLAYLANGRHLAAAYLSMTRGGGGHNLVARGHARRLPVRRSQEQHPPRAAKEKKKRRKKQRRKTPITGKPKHKTIHKKKPTIKPQ